MLTYSPGIIANWGALYTFFIIESPHLGTSKKRRLSD